MFDSISPQVDGVVALDDGSTDGSAEYLAGRAEVLELMRNPADWIASLDADHRVEAGFRDRAERLIRRGRPFGVKAWSWQVRELWETEDQVAGGRGVG